MSYHIDLQHVPPGHEAPALLGAFAEWLAGRERGSIGWFDALAAEEIPATWSPENAARLQRAGFSFLNLPDGSLLALLDTGVEDAPRAVALLDSEGEARTVASSLEEFLLLWSKGETGIGELDDEDGAAGRRAMKSWLTKKKVKAPRAPDFDFQAWLDGTPVVVASPPLQEARPDPPIFASLPPAFRVLADLEGRRADDPKVIDFVTRELGGKVPPSTTDEGSAKEVKAAKRGFSLWFGHDELNDAFPLIQKTANTFLPYVSEISLTNKWPEKLPFGLEWKHTQADVRERLGTPIVEPLFRDEDLPTRTFWSIELDPGRTFIHVKVTKTGLSMTLRIVTTSALSSRHIVPPDPEVGLFVAWALSRGILDESRFPSHRALIERIKRRKEKGSVLVKVAMPRGLWEDHVRPDEALRNTAYRMFNSMAGLSLTRDLIDIFGERTNQHGHDEPILDDDSWSAVDRATPILDKRFAPWVKIAR